MTVCADIPGSLRQRIEIQAEAATGDGGGGQTDPWASSVVVATVWANVEPLRGDERLRAMQLEDVVTHKITIRYRPGITARMRVKFGARLLNIRAVIDPQEQQRVLELMCEEGVAT
jgi:SPP1 family predicted phage head-tail adaptor